jgi:methylthioribose-1-phosphate isomerase/methylthioribulose-1-phosphate dehydratase
MIGVERGGAMVLSVPRELAAELAVVSRALYGRGWMDGTAGNLSVRLDDDHALVTASGRSKGELAARDTVPVSIATGAPVATDALPPNGHPRSSAETSIHLALYRALPDCGAVVHAHPPYSTAVAARAAVDGVVRFARFEIIKGFGLADPSEVHVPVFTNWPHVPDIADDIAKRLADGADVPVLLIAHHGATAWGATLEQARNRLECLEALCRLELIVNRLEAR